MTKKNGRAKETKDICGATASGGVLVCVRERGHAKDHSSSSDRKPAQHATWSVGADDRIAVKVFSHGKQSNEWTEDGPKDDRAKGQPCGCGAAEAGDHVLGDPHCAVPSHEGCVCRGTEWKAHLTDASGCENPPTNADHKRTWFTDIDGRVTKFAEEPLVIEGDAPEAGEDEDPRPEWLRKQTAERDAEGRQPQKERAKPRPAEPSPGQWGPISCTSEALRCTSVFRRADTSKAAKPEVRCDLEKSHSGCHRSPPYEGSHVTVWDDDRAGGVRIPLKKYDDARDRKVEPRPNFDATWKRLAEEGVCDSFGGGEYTRVRAEWNRAGGDPETFIRKRANVSPGNGLDDLPQPTVEEEEAVEAHIAEAEDEENELDDSIRSDDEREFSRKMREDRERHAADLERDIKPEKMIAPTGETIACAGRTYAVHPMARLFPTPEKQYRETVESMRVSGQIHDVELLDEPDNPVIDGCTRLRACEELGITPRTKIIHVDDKLAYVKAVNLDRRHLDESRRAVAAADLAQLAHGANQHTRGAADVPVLTQAQAAAAMGVSERLVRDAVRVRNSGTEEVQSAVREGRLKVGAAAELVKLDPSKQRDLVAKVTKGNSEVRPGKVRALVKQEQKREVVQRINRDLVAPMPVGPFGLIVVDYSWKFRNSDGHEGSRGHMPYPPMEWGAILAHAREGAKRAADDCVLGLWVVNAYLLKVHEVLAAWDGFVDMEAPITWNKVHVGMGIRGPRHVTEHLILAERGKPTHTLNEMTTLFTEPRVVGAGGHSKKPDRIYDELAKHVPGPRLECFAIGEREGWATWGAEASGPIATERKPKRSKIFTKTDDAVRAP